MRSYRRFLEALGEGALESLRQAELLGHHHAAPGTKEWVHYEHVSAWAEEINERIDLYDNAKRKAWDKGAARRKQEENRLGRYTASDHRLRGVPAGEQPSIGSDPERDSGDDPDPHDSPFADAPHDTGSQ